MRTFTFVLAALGLAAGLLVSGGGKVQARSASLAVEDDEVPPPPPVQDEGKQEEGTRYAVVTIKNPTSMPVNYQFRWGTGDKWANLKVKPGEAIWHAFPLNEAGSAPTPQIRFDYVLNDDKVTWKGYSLLTRTSAVRTTEAGKPYHFGVSACGRYLVLLRD